MNRCKVNINPEMPKVEKCKDVKFEIMSTLTERSPDGNTSIEADCIENGKNVFSVMAVISNRVLGDKKTIRLILLQKYNEELKRRSAIKYHLDVGDII